MVHLPRRKYKYTPPQPTIQNIPSRGGTTTGGGRSPLPGLLLDRGGRGAATLVATTSRGSGLLTAASDPRFSTGVRTRAGVEWEGGGVVDAVGAEDVGCGVRERDVEGGKTMCAGSVGGAGLSDLLGFSTRRSSRR